jgi:glutathione S-transferase
VAPVAAALLPAGKGRADRVSTRLSTPVLIADGQVVADSQAIVAWVSRRFGDSRSSLHWTTRAAELEQQFAERLGADTRRLAYHYILDDDTSMRELAVHNVSPAQARLFMTLLPAVRRVIHDKLRVNAEHAARSLTRIEEAFAAVDDRLSDGRPYLLGDRFSAADLAFASLSALALIVQPSEGYGAWLPPIDRAPPEFAAIARRLRDSSAGRFALRMFAEERGRRVLPCEPIP